MTAKIAVAASALLGLVSFASGCLTYTEMKTARTVDPGTNQYNITLGLRHPHTNSPVVPVSAFEFRHGVTRGLDLGVEVTATSLGLNATIQLVRSRWVDLALAPAVTAGAELIFDDETVVFAQAKVPLLIGLNFDAGGDQLVLGPTVLGLSSSFNGQGTFDTLLLGGTVGISLGSSSLRVLPLFALFVPVVGHAIPSLDPTPSAFTQSPTSRPVIFQIGVGLSFGNDGRPKTKG